MHHVYAITHTFLDLIQRTKLLPDSLNATAVLQTPQNKVCFFVCFQINLSKGPFMNYVRQKGGGQEILTIPCKGEGGT